MVVSTKGVTSIRLSQVPFWLHEWLLASPKGFCSTRLLIQVPFWVYKWLLAYPKGFCSTRLFSQVPFWVHEWLLASLKGFCSTRLLIQVPFWVHKWLLASPKGFCSTWFLIQVPFWVHKWLLASPKGFCSIRLLFRYHFPISSLTAISFLIPRYKHYWPTELPQYNYKYPISQWANKFNSGPATLHKVCRCCTPKSALLVLQWVLCQFSYYIRSTLSNINIQTVHTATTQTDFMRTVATKWF